MKEHLEAGVAEMEAPVKLERSELDPKPAAAPAESVMDRSLRIRQASVRPLIETLAIRHLELSVKKSATVEELNEIYRKAEALCDSAEFSPEEKAAVLAQFHRDAEEAPLEAPLPVPKEEAKPAPALTSTERIQSKQYIESLGETYEKTRATAQRLTDEGRMTNVALESMALAMSSLKEKAAASGAAAGFSDAEIARLFENPTPREEKAAVEKTSFFSRAKDRLRRGFKWLAVGAAALTNLSGGTSTKRAEAPSKSIVNERLAATPGTEAADATVFAETHARMEKAKGVEKTVTERFPGKDENYGYEENTPEGRHLKDSTEISTYTAVEEFVGDGIVPVVIQPGMDTSGLNQFPAHFEGHLKLDTVLEDGTRIPKELLSRMDTAYYNHADFAGQIEYLSHAANNENLGTRIVENKLLGKLNVIDNNNIVVATMPNLLGRARGDSLNGSTTADPYSRSYTPAGIFTFQNVSGIVNHSEFKDLLHVNIPAAEDQGIYIHSLLSRSVAEQEAKMRAGDMHESHGCMRVRESDMGILAKYFKDTGKHLITILPEKKVEGKVTFIDPFTLEEVSVPKEEAQAYKDKIIDAYVKNTLVTKTKVGVERYMSRPDPTKPNGVENQHTAVYKSQRTNIKKTIFRQLLEDTRKFAMSGVKKG